jgi:hypothetical protein
MIACRTLVQTDRNVEHTNRSRLLALTPDANSPSMSDQPTTLDLLGHIVRDLQGYERELCTRIEVLEIDMIGLKATVAGFGERLSDLQRTTEGLQKATRAGFNDIGDSNRRLERMLTDLTSRPAS